MSVIYVDSSVLCGIIYIFFVEIEFCFKCTDAKDVYRLQQFPHLVSTCCGWLNFCTAFLEMLSFGVEKFIYKVSGLSIWKIDWFIIVQRKKVYSFEFD